MVDTNSVSTRQWTKGRALTLFVMCLVVGAVGGWFIRGFSSPFAAAASATASPIAASPALVPARNPTQSPAQERIKQMADAQAAPLIQKLKSDPDNFALLVNVGNLYYDAQQYVSAVDFYGRAIKLQPSNAAVRTDMATALWFMGETDNSIAEFNKALAYAPTNPNTLFNLGVAKWKGKGDNAGAVADWQKLLAANPNYEAKDKVLQMIAQVRIQTVAVPGAPAN